MTLSFILENNKSLISKKTNFALCKKSRYNKDMTVEDFFKQALEELKRVKRDLPEAEKMPKGYLLAGIDIQLVKPIIVLNEIFKAKTQWSCQGHLNSRWDLAYIRFQEGFEAPKALVSRLKDKGFVTGFMRPFEDKPEVEICIIRAFNHDEVVNQKDRVLKNQEFLKELNYFADEVINKYIN